MQRPDPTSQKSKLQFEAVGTHWRIVIQSYYSKQWLKDLEKEVLARIEKFDKTYSRFRSDSLVTDMSRKQGKYRLPEDAHELLQLYLRMYELTNGLVTPTIGQLLSDTGYDANYSLSPSRMRPAPEAKDILRYEHPYLIITQPVLLDFGAAGKGYLADLVAEKLKTKGLRSFFIDAGGDTVHVDTEEKPIRVGLENPFDFKEVVGVAEIANKSICASASNRRRWKEFHHIMNPQTMKPVDSVIATWVVADTGLLADMIASCLFFTEPEVLLAGEYIFEFFIIYSDGSCRSSEEFPMVATELT